jgi:outer membrane protein OmpA-like peptidoglycan-associated protein
MNLSDWLICRFLLFLFIISVTVSAFQMKREAYIDIPTANFEQGLYISVNSGYPIRDVDDVKFDPNAGIDFTYDRFGAALKWYDVNDFVLDLSYQVSEGRGSAPSFAFGIGEISLNKYISTAGVDETFNDDEYAERAPEAWSFYGVASKKVNKLIEVSAGLGRGKFVGYGSFSEYINTDLLSSEKHEVWSFGLFGGVKFIFSKNLSFIAEADGRDVNIGLGYRNERIKGTLVLSKLEVWGDSENDFSPRVGLDLSYRIKGVKEKIQPVRIAYEEYIEPVKVDTMEPDIIEEDEKEPEAGDSMEIKDNFENIKAAIEAISLKFPYARAELTIATLDLLKKIIELLSRCGNFRLLIIGHTCSIGSIESNQILSEERAKSVERYLIENGIPADKINREALGERRPIADNGTEEGRIKNRRVEFALYRAGNK